MLTCSFPSQSPGQEAGEVAVGVGVIGGGPPVAVRVRVGVTEAVTLGVTEAVAVRVAVGLTGDGVMVAVRVRVGVGVIEAVALGVTTGDAVGVTVGGGVVVAVSVDVTVAVDVTVGLGVGDWTASGAENCEVFPARSVAVAVTYGPATPAGLLISQLPAPSAAIISS